MICIYDELDAFWCLLSNPETGSPDREASTRPVWGTTIFKALNLAPLVRLCKLRELLTGIERIQTSIDKPGRSGPQQSLVYCIKQSCHWQLCIESNVSETLWNRLIDKCDAWCVPSHVLLNFPNAVVSSRVTRNGWRVLTLPPPLTRNHLYRDILSGPFVDDQMIRSIDALIVLPLVGHGGSEDIRDWDIYAQTSPVSTCNHSDTSQAVHQLDSASEDHTVSIYFTCRELSHLMKSGAALLNQIRNESRCIIRIHDDRDAAMLPRRHATQMVTISGHEHSVSAAALAIEKIANRQI